MQPLPGPKSAGGTPSPFITAIASLRQELLDLLGPAGLVNLPAFDADFYGAFKALQEAMARSSGIGQVQRQLQGRQIGAFRGVVIEIDFLWPPALLKIDHGRRPPGGSRGGEGERERCGEAEDQKKTTPPKMEEPSTKRRHSSPLRTALPC